MLRLKLRKSKSASKEIKERLVKMDYSLLKSLAIHFLKPCIFFLLFHFRKLIGKLIPGNCLLSLFVNFYLLFEEMVIDESNSTKMALQNLLLELIWIKPKFICSVHLHIFIYTFEVQNLSI